MKIGLFIEISFRKCTQKSTVIGSKVSKILCIFVNINDTFNNQILMHIINIDNHCCTVD